jgi:hypothetical protein
MPFVESAMLAVALLKAALVDNDAIEFGVCCVWKTVVRAGSGQPQKISFCTNSCAGASSSERNGVLVHRDGFHCLSSLGKDSIEHIEQGCFINILKICTRCHKSVTKLTYSVQMNLIFNTT